MKILGTLKYEKNIDRYVIWNEDGQRSELHCGDGFDVQIKEYWIRTTIEMAHYPGGHEYFLTCPALGLKEIAKNGVLVRQGY